MSNNYCTRERFDEGVRGQLYDFRQNFDTRIFAVVNFGLERGLNSLKAVDRHELRILTVLYVGSNLQSCFVFERHDPARSQRQLVRYFEA